MPSAVVIGGGVAGYSVVHRLRAGVDGSSWQGDIHLVCAEDVLPYDRPPLSKEVLRHEWSPAKTLYQNEEWYAERDVTLHRGVKAKAIDPLACTVSLDNGTLLSYDSLVLVTGGRPRRLSIPGADLTGVHVLRTLEDVAAIQADVGSATHAVVIGAGFIGAEVAASLRSLGLQIVMLEMDEVPFARVLGAEVGQFFAQLHTAEGVQVVCNETAVAFRGMKKVEAVEGMSGTMYLANFVIVGVGIDPAMELAVEAGMKCANGICVDEFGRTSLPNVYAAGDVAEHPNSVLGRRVRLEHLRNATNQGDIVARNILGQESRHEEVPWFWSDQYDVNFQYAGHPDEWDEVVWSGVPKTRSFTVFYLKNSRIVGALSANQPRKNKAAMRLIRQGTLVNAPDLRDPETDLRQLAKKN